MRTILLLVGFAAPVVLGLGCGASPACVGEPSDPGEAVQLKLGASLNGTSSCSSSGTECPGGGECSKVMLAGCATEPLCLTQADKDKLTCPDGKHLASLESNPGAIVCR